MSLLAAPTCAERARALLGRARTADLHTRSGSLAPTATTAALEQTRDGLPLVWLEGSTPAVAALATRRVASLVVREPGPGWAVRLVGSFRMERPEASGRRAYRANVLSVRVLGPRPVTIPVEEFLRARRDRADDVLHHLAHAHHDDLLHWGRRHGREAADVEVVTPRALDERCLELSLIGDHGVERVRMPLEPRGRAEGSLSFLDCVQSTCHRCGPAPDERTSPR